MKRTINVQVATFAGLGLPRTLNRPVESDASIRDVLQSIYTALPNPDLGPQLIVSTTDGRRLHEEEERPISTLLRDGASLLPLRLSSRLCGGKGGFGSQLRAAGGRMSSKKNRDRENRNGSSRNLDGRRLRTVDEAKRLAQYLEIKPEMERKEKEERRARWEAVVQAAEETEEKIKAGKMGSNQGRLNADYMESKELAEDKVRDAITKAMKGGMLESTGSESSMEEARDSDADSKQTSSNDSDEAGPSFFGWDEEDDESVIDVADDHAITINEVDAASGLQLQADLENATQPGKGKARAQ